MIQRIQTVWLVLAATSGFIMTDAPLYKATLPNNIIQTVIASDNLFLFALIIATALLATTSVFLFKKRPTQFKLTIVALLMATSILIGVVWKVNTYKTANNALQSAYQWGALLPIAMIILFLIAARAIYKDEKLVKSLDRLR
jgi:hypothetical protein